MHIFEPASYEEGNHMLRLYEERQFHFLRVNFCADDKETVFFNIKTKPLLEYYHRVLSGTYEGIKLGNRRLNFFGYSNSQLKQRAFWFICDNDPAFIGQIEKEFDNEDTDLANLMSRPKSSQNIRQSEECENPEEDLHDANTNEHNAGVQRNQAGRNRP